MYERSCKFFSIASVAIITALFAMCFAKVVSMPSVTMREIYQAGLFFGLAQISFCLTLFAWALQRKHDSAKAAGVQLQMGRFLAVHATALACSILVIVLATQG